MPHRTKEKLTPVEALDEIRRLMNREMSYRWRMWKQSVYAHEYHVVNCIRREIKKITKKVIEDANSISN